MRVPSPSMSTLNGTCERTPVVLQTVRLDGFLSFAPGSEPFHLRALNVLVGPNGAGKTNLVEALRLLSATPKDLEAVLRQGGGPDAWIWQGRPPAARAAIDAVLDSHTHGSRPPAPYPPSASPMARSASSRSSPPCTHPGHRACCASKTRNSGFTQIASRCWRICWSRRRTECNS